MKFCPCCGAEMEDGLDECPECVKAFLERKSDDTEEEEKDAETEAREKEEKKAEMALTRDKHAVIAFVLSIVSLCFATSLITPVDDFLSVKVGVAIAILSALFVVTLITIYVSRMFHFKAFDEGATKGLASVSGLLRKIALGVGASFYVINLAFLIISILKK